MQRNAGNKIFSIFLIVFKKLFNVDIYSVCLILLLLLLLLNVITFAISYLKLQTFVKTIAVVQNSRSPLRSSAIMISNITNSLSY